MRFRGNSLAHESHSCPFAATQVPEPFPPPLTPEDPLNRERWTQVRKLFAKLVDLPRDHQKKAIEQECSIDPELRSHLESLLEAHHREGLLDQPVAPSNRRASPFEPGGKLGRYEILREIGRGGMGVVYLAKDQMHQRKVALKVVLPQLLIDKESKRRFLREARLTAAIHHDNVCRVLGFGKEDGRDFIVMEYVEGESLQKRLKRGPIRLETGLKMITQIAEALDSAHQKGIIHRDLKTRNILLCHGNQVKVMDFGLAKRTGAGFLEDKITQTGLAIGTLNYMSPEQLKGEKADERSDIFSLGILAFEILTGRHPFRGESDVEQAEAILKESPVYADEDSGTIPSPLRDLIRRMLAKPVQDRPQSTSEVLRVLIRSSNLDFRM